MDQFFTEVEHLMNGQALPVRSKLDLMQETKFIPLTKVNVGYVVYGIAFNELGQVLMMQEAKKSCFGKWYLPAGRLEPNESITEGVIREVKEETGMNFEPKTLIEVLSVGRSYHRFSFIGEVCGGELLSVTNASKESLQGAWVPVEKILNEDPEYPLRAPDIIDLIKLGQKWKDGLLSFANLLPVINSHQLLSLRILLVTSASDHMEILSGTNENLFLPEGEFMGYGSHPLNNILKEIFSDIKEKLTVYGILSVEYNGQPAHEHDGLCISVLIYLPNKDSAVLKSSKIYEWMPIVDKALETKIMDRLQPNCNVHYKF